MTDEEFLRRLRVMQVITVALVLGVIVFLAIALFVIAPPARPAMLSWVALGLLAVQVPMATILPVVMTRAAVRQIAAGAWQRPRDSGQEAFATDASKLLAIRQTRLVIGLALLEGAAFFAGIAYLIEGQALALAVALAVMLAHFPTEAKVRAWLERQTERLAELRAGGTD